MYKWCITLQILKTSQTFVANYGWCWWQQLLYSLVLYENNLHSQVMTGLTLKHWWPISDTLSSPFHKSKSNFPIHNPRLCGCHHEIHYNCFHRQQLHLFSVTHPLKEEEMDSEKDYQWIKPCKNSQMKFWPLTIKPMMADNSVTLPKFLTSWNMIYSYENWILLYKVKLGSHSESYLNNRK